MTQERTNSVISEFRAAKTMKAVKRARRRACYLPIADQLEVLKHALVAYRRVRQ